jgi:hypothetical protein
MKRPILSLLLLAALLLLPERAYCQGRTFPANHPDMIAPDSLVVTRTTLCPDLDFRLNRGNASGLRRDLGVVYAGTTTTTRITFTNPLDKVTRIQEARLLDGTQGFSIVSMTPGPLPVELPKNASITFTIAAEPGEANREYTDSLHIEFCCGGEMTVGLNIGTAPTTSGIDEKEKGADPVVVHPNPVIGAGTISFHLDAPGSARLIVSDASGVDVGSIERKGLAAGTQSVVWDASGVPAGLYYYRLVTGARVATGSVMVVR